MSRWKQNASDPTEVVSAPGETGFTKHDDDIGHVCDCPTAERAEQIVIEHNAHAALLSALKAVKKRIHFVGMPQEPPNWAPEITMIEAAISIAEGKIA